MISRVAVLGHMVTTYDLRSHPEGGELWRQWESGENVEFVDDAAEERYQTRARRVRRAIELKEPDRVPVQLVGDFLAGHLAGVTFEEMMYDAEKARGAYRSFMEAFDPDLLPILPLPSGHMIDVVGYELYDWPGDGLRPDQGYQANEREYMKADEYDELINNVEGFLLRKYFPRVFSNLEGLRGLPQLMLSTELPFVPSLLLPFGTPPVQESLATLQEAGEEALRWQEAVGSVMMEGNAMGFPLGWGGFSKAPFDVIADTLRSTREAMIDMRRRPEVVKEAAEALVPQMVQMGVDAARMTGTPMMIFVLHKGADGFMSPDDYREFYWPTLKQTAEGIMEHGIVPWFFAEGTYDSRLDIVANDHPDGPVVWFFDKTDMALAKETLGDRACIAGNVPTDVIKTGTPEKVDDYCQRLIEDVGPAGFILSPGVTVYRAPAENLHAIVDSVTA